MKRRVFAAIAATVTLFTAGCSGGGPTGTDSYSDDPRVLNIVLGSEQTTVFDQVVRPWCEREGLTCLATPMGSVDQAVLLDRDDCASLPPYDVFWFASSVFAQLGDRRCGSLTGSETTFSSPVVFAGWRQRMAGLGFTPGSDTTIESILAAVESGRTKVWITNPAQSNSGATVLLGFLNHFAGNPPGTPLTMAQLESPQVRDGITRFARAFSYTPPSTGTMMSECVAQPDRCDGVFTYEALVLEKNKELVAQGREPMTLVYPQGSLAFADSPIAFLPHGENTAKQANFERLRDYLVGPEAQHELTRLGRRPNSGIGLALPDAPRDVFDPAWGVETTATEQPVTFPAVDVIQAALDNYQTTYRRPGDFVYCIDGSGSMEGAGWEGVEDAVRTLLDPELSRKHKLLVNPQDSTTMIVFDGTIKGGPWTVDGNDPGELTELKDRVLALGPIGGTDIRRCLGEAARVLRDHPADGRKRTVVLMTDGQDNGRDNAAIRQLTALGVPVLAIGFGDVDERDLRGIASSTGGSYLPAGDDVSTALRTAAAFR
ncbi:VWA domain-containing protein [Nocardia harenae]|uniref:VWA domain-containing protein n=1 Tax=Nocardia harenae TaxID=358707 RepID=UPI0009FC0458|nr:VWA domain-containing protein [Nocardia harenae]